jgi:hypothetical protein
VGARQRSAKGDRVINGFTEVVEAPLPSMDRKASGDSPIGHASKGRAEVAQYSVNLPLGSAEIVGDRRAGDISCGRFGRQVKAGDFGGHLVGS